MTTSPPRIALFLVAISSITFAACGGGDAAAPPKSPDAKPATTSPRHDKDEDLGEPQSVEEAQRQIASLRVSLDSSGRSALESESRPEKPGLQPGPDSAPTTPSTRRPSDPKPTDSKATSSGSEDMCVSPCRALASMKRAVDALCRMTGDADTRCVDAKKTLAESTTRVSTCKCESR